MRICLLNDIEGPGGGAIVAASRLAEGLCAAGHEVIRIVSTPHRDAQRWRTLQLVPTRSQWLNRMFTASRNPGLASPGLEAALDLPYQRLIVSQLRKLLKEVRPDVINIHNIHGAGWSVHVVAEAAKWAPVVWTMHDCWSFTGRCAYFYDCELFKTGCNSSCPTADEYPRLARWRIAAAWRERQRLMQGVPGLVAVSPSRWLADCAQQGLWQGHRIELIPYGLDTGVFQPVPKPVARQALNLPTDRPVVLMAAAQVDEPRKGRRLLRDALTQVEQPLTLLALGHGTLPLDCNRHCVIPAGWVGSARLLATLYSAADLMVNPTLADNAPLVLTEAMACGTPCVCTPVGGCPELVRPGKTGWLAAEPSAEALASALSTALCDLAAGTDLAASCREAIEQEHTLEQHVAHYLECFESLV